MSNQRATTNFLLLRSFSSPPHTINSSSRPLKVWQIVTELRIKLEDAAHESQKQKQQIEVGKQVLHRTRDRVQGCLFNVATSDNADDSKLAWRVTVLEQEVERLEAERIDALTEAADFEKLASDMQAQMEKIRLHAKVDHDKCQKQAELIQRLEQQGQMLEKSRASIIEERDEAIKQALQERNELIVIKNASRNPTPAATPRLNDAADKLKGPASPAPSWQRSRSPGQGIVGSLLQRPARSQVAEMTTAELLRAKELQRRYS